MVELAGEAVVPSWVYLPSSGSVWRARSWLGVPGACCSHLKALLAGVVGTWEGELEEWEKAGVVGTWEGELEEWEKEGTLPLVLGANQCWWTEYVFVEVETVQYMLLGSQRSVLSSVRSPVSSETRDCCRGDQMRTACTVFSLGMWDPVLSRECVSLPEVSVPAVARLVSLLHRFPEVEECRNHSQLGR